jgi:hypothetical protein
LDCTTQSRRFATETRLRYTPTRQQAVVGRLRPSLVAKISCLKNWTTKKPRPVGRAAEVHSEESGWDTRRGIMEASRLKMFCRKFSRYFASGLNLSLPNFVGVREQRMHASSLHAEPRSDSCFRSGLLLFSRRSLEFCRFCAHSPATGDGVRRFSWSSPELLSTSAEALAGYPSPAGASPFWATARPAVTRRSLPVRFGGC